MEIKRLLEQRLQAKLRVISHQSFNRTFVGFSQQYQQSVFVKVFLQERNWLTEKAVNEQLNSRVLAAFKVDVEPILYVLVMTDMAPADIAVPVSKALAVLMGEKLAIFHAQVRPFAGIRQDSEPFIKIHQRIKQLRSSSMRNRLIKIFKYFVHDQIMIETELLNSSTVLHGDVGVRNYQFVTNQLVLIDYEKVQLGVKYQDFIKLFYQDFKLQPELMAAFMEGYTLKLPEPKISQLMQAFLLFKTACGIMSYTDKIEDQPFKQIGEKMLVKVEEDLL